MMGSRLVIAGAGGFGRGVFTWVIQSKRFRAEHQIADVVFIDDAKPANDIEGQVVSPICSYAPKDKDLVVCALGSPTVRRNIVDQLSRRGAKFCTFVDDRAVVASSVTIGKGTIICPGTVISAQAVIGDHVHANFNCSIGHDSSLGDFTTLSPAVNIMGEVSVGTAVFFGGNSVVLPRLNVAPNTTLGAGAVCVKSISEAGITWVGNPAQPIDYRSVATH